MLIFTNRWLLKHTDHSVIASGGVASINDLIELKELNLSNLYRGVLWGKPLSKVKYSTEELKYFMNILFLFGVALLFTV